LFLEAMPRQTVASASYPVSGTARAVASVALRDDGLHLVSVRTCRGWLRREEQLVRSDLAAARALADRLVGRLLGGSVDGAWREERSARHPCR
jgi:hypothetical protein